MGLSAHVALLLERAAAEIGAGESTQYDRGLAGAVLARVEDAEASLAKLGERVATLAAHKRRGEAMVRAAAGLMIEDDASLSRYESLRLAVADVRGRGVELSLTFESRLAPHPEAAWERDTAWSDKLRDVFIPTELRECDDSALPDDAIGPAVALLAVSIAAEARDGFTDPHLFADGLLTRYGARARPALLAMLADDTVAADSTSRWASVRRRSFALAAKWSEADAEPLFRAALEVGWNVELTTLPRAGELRRRLVAEYVDSPYSAPF